MKRVLTVLVAMVVSVPALAQGAWSTLFLLRDMTSSEAYSSFDGEAGFAACEGVQRREGETCVGIKIPAILVGGQERSFALLGQGAEGGRLFTLRAEGAEAVCSVAGSGKTCLVSFPGLTVSSAAVEAYIRANVPAEDRQRALFAAQEFARAPALRWFHGIQ